MVVRCRDCLFEQSGEFVITIETIVARLMAMAGMTRMPMTCMTVTRMTVTRMPVTCMPVTRISVRSQVNVGHGVVDCPFCGRHPSMRVGYSGRPMTGQHGAHQQD